LQNTGPVFRILQSISADLSIVARLIDACVEQLTKLREDVDDFFNSIKDETAEFCAKHDIDSQLRSIRLRKARRMPGEEAVDARVGMVETAFKTDAVIRGLDVVLLQLKHRFSRENMESLHEMKHFTPSSLISSSVISAQDIEHMCFYSRDATTVARERNDFVLVYQSIPPLIERPLPEVSCWVTVKVLDLQDSANEFCVDGVGVSWMCAKTLIDS